MPLGNILTGTEAQYVAMKDDKGTWRVLNTWHDDIKNLGFYFNFLNFNYSIPN